RRARVALGDGVGGDEPERSAAAQEIECTPEEMRGQVGIAVRLVVQYLQPLDEAVPVGFGDGVLPGERRIAHKRIEPRVLSVEHLRKFDAPMEWCDGGVRITRFLRKLP